MPITMRLSATLILMLAGLGQASAGNLYAKLEAGYAWAESAGLDDRQGYESDTCLICVPGEVDDLDDGALAGVGLGYHVNEAFRVDLTYTHRAGNDLAAGDSIGGNYHSDIKSDAVMVSGYYDLPVSVGKFKPYVGAGIGWARNRMSGIRQDWNVSPAEQGWQRDPGGSASGFAWQVMAGLTYQINAAWSADIGYRHFDGGKLETNAGTSEVQHLGSPYYEYPSGGLKGHLRTDELLLTLRYEF